MDAETSARLKELFTTKLNSAMRLYLDTCARCGVCVEACHAYASSPRPAIRPWAAQRSSARCSRSYFKLEGKVAPWLGEVITARRRVSSTW